MVEYTANTALQILPDEMWRKISSFVYQSDWQDLRSLKSLSLACQTLREATLPLLYMSCILTVGGYGPLSERSEHPTFMWFSPAEQMKTSTLEYLRFITSPRIAFAVRSVRVRCIDERDKGPMYYEHHGAAIELIHEVFLSLHHLTSVKELTLERLPISTYHLQALCHSKFSPTLISFEYCISTDSQIGKIPLSYSALRIRGNSSSGSLVKAMLTESLTELTISRWGQHTVIEQVLESGMRFEALRTLAVDERVLTLLIQHPQSFPNVLSLSVSRPGGYWYPIDGIGNGPYTVIPRTTFPKLETLECPFKLLPQFLGHNFCGLTLTQIHSVTDFHTQDEEIRTTTDQSRQLLQHLSTLKLMFVMDMDDLLNEFLAHCHELRSCEAHLWHPTMTASSQYQLESDHYSVVLGVS
jgi:hypothetical protein